MALTGKLIAFATKREKGVYQIVVRERDVRARVARAGDLKSRRGERKTRDARARPS